MKAKFTFFLNNIITQQLISATKPGFLTGDVTYKRCKILKKHILWILNILAIILKILTVQHTSTCTCMSLHTG